MNSQLLFVLLLVLVGAFLLAEVDAQWGYGGMGGGWGGGWNRGYGGKNT
jgi:hypothetical protein